MSWRNLRSISSDPLSNFLSKLSQDQIMREAQADSGVADNLEEEKFIGKHHHSIVEIRDIGVPFANVIPTDRVFLMPMEPDRNRLRLWVEFNSGADTQNDYSLFDSVIQNKGYVLPVPITSPTYDEGVVGGQLALQYNNTDNMPKSAKAQFGEEVAYTVVLDNPNIRLSSYLDGTIPGYDGFCISCLVRPMQLYIDTSDIGNTYQRRLCRKADNSTTTYGYELRITELGTLIIIFRRAGVNHEFFVSGMFTLAAGADYNPADYLPADYRTINPLTGVPFETPNSNVQNFWSRIDVKFKFSDNSCIVVKDGVNQTVQTTSGNANWATPTTTKLDLYINAGPWSDASGRAVGTGITEWGDFRIYAGMLTFAESGHLYTNKYTISDIAFGCPAIMSSTIQSAGGVTVPDPTKDPFGITKMIPSKEGGNEWYSTTWNNGINRVVQNPPPACTPDPYDSQLFLNRSGGPTMTINGAGIMKLEGGSPRVVVLSSWKNVESTVYMRVPTASMSNMDCAIRAKTDHFCVENEDFQFGGYIFTTDFTAQNVRLRRELTHDIGYSTPQATVPKVLPANTWLGFKAILYNNNQGNVKLEYYMDTTGGLNGGTWIKVTEATDNGTWGGSGGGPPPYTPATFGSAIRQDSGTAGTFCEYKWWSIREIDHPLGEVSTDPDVL